MQFDIPALDLEVSPLGSSEDFLFGAGCQFAGGAGDGHFPVGGGACLAALALHADAAAGGVQVDAGFLVGFLFVAGLADGEERDALLDGQAVVALGDEVGVVAGSDGEVLAGGNEVVFGGELGDAGRGGELEARSAPGGDGSCATLGGLDAVALPCARIGAVTGGGAQGGFGLFEAVEGGEFVGLGIILEAGVLFLGDIGQAVAEVPGFLGLGDGFAAIQLRAGGVRSCIGAEEQPVPRA